MYKLRDRVRIIHEDGSSVNEMVGEIGIVVHIVPDNPNIIGIDFGKQIEPDT